MQKNPQTQNVDTISGIPTEHSAPSASTSRCLSSLNVELPTQSVNLTSQQHNAPPVPPTFSVNPTS